MLTVEDILKKGAVLNSKQITVEQFEQIKNRVQEQMDEYIPKPMTMEEWYALNIPMSI